MARCASAASSSGKTCRTTLLIVPWPASASSCGTTCALEPENAGADLGDDLVEGLGIAVDLLRDGGFAAGRVALDPQAEGEQLLDDVVVQVTSYVHAHAGYLRCWRRRDRLILPGRSRSEEHTS